MPLRNKKVIILGGSKGIGKEIASQLKSLNLKIISCSRKNIDTSDLSSVNSFIKKNKETDILVLNSGGPPPLKINQIKERDWKKYFNQLFLGYFLILQKIKIKKNGYVFYISSSIIKEPGNSLVISSSLRSAMSSLLKSFSIEYSKNNISTINIAPGPFKTRRVKELVKNLRKFEKNLPTKKIGDPKEIGKFIKFVIKNKIKYLTGSTVYFDGNILKSYC
jgi:3-oxoacyl-[acyl-carrier protein] reductase